MMSDPDHLSSEVQVDETHYADHQYDTLDRWSSFWYQIQTIRKANAKSLLEIGVGSGVCSWYARERMGVDVTTCDFAEDLKPDVVADIRNLRATFSAEQFDMAVAFQVLEHLPFEEFPKCLEQLSFVVKKNIAISLPQFGTEAGLILRFRRFSLKWGAKIPRYKKWSLETDGFGEHHWEIGVNGSSLSQVKQHISRYFHINETYVLPENPYHRFFELSKKP